MVDHGKNQVQHVVALMMVILLKEQVIVDLLKLNLDQNYLNPLFYRLANRPVT